MLLVLLVLREQLEPLDQPDQQDPPVQQEPLVQLVQRALRVLLEPQEPLE